METRHEYEARERREVLAQLEEIEKAPIAERKENLTDFADNYTVAIVAERIGWLINGSYGQGSYLLAQDMLKSRGNRTAQLCQLTLAMEWHVSNVYARQWYNALPEDKQVELTAAIQAKIDYHLAEMEEN